MYVGLLKMYKYIDHLLILLSRIGNKHGFLKLENSSYHGCEAVVLPICVIFIKKKLLAIALIYSRFSTNAYLQYTR